MADVTVSFEDGPRDPRSLRERLAHNSRPIHIGGQPTQSHTCPVSPAERANQLVLDTFSRRAQQAEARLALLEAAVASTVIALKRLAGKHEQLGMHDTAMAYQGAAELVRHVPDVLTKEALR